LHRLEEAEDEVEKTTRTIENRLQKLYRFSEPYNQTEQDQKAILATESGFLDFIADFEESTLEMNDILLEMTNETEELGQAVTNGAAKLNTLDGPGKSSQARKIANSISRIISQYSKSLQNHIPKLENTIQNMKENFSSAIAWTESHPDSELEEPDYDKLRESVLSLWDSAANTNDQLLGFQQAVVSVRQKGISREMNYSTERLVKTLDKLMLTVDKVMDFSHGAAGLLDDEFGGID
jgi:chromosome segregation ATPase